MREVTKRKATPRPRPVCVVHTGSPAVLAGSRPLRNSHIPVLGHARYPLRSAPLLGAPEGPRVPSTRLPAWNLRELLQQDLRAGYRSEATAAAAARSFCSAANASLSTLAEHLESEAGLEDQAGSRVEGKWGPLWSAEERGGLQGKASMSEHRDVRVAQRPARREHRREPRVPDAPGARKWGGFLLVTSL